ncbi:hypothetical protein MATL_G00104010 [Megalops atlanticus]|uniref:Uncharacterized protein n=1 Tax=Megalops atlanticus TaxID=7932 RepID=A0A9D3TDG6_MEGAT|nr:hypothetical protein MATL_G00104010 [Megalops atlanticus]
MTKMSNIQWRKKSNAYISLSVSRLDVFFSNVFVTLFGPVRNEEPASLFSQQSMRICSSFTKSNTAICTSGYPTLDRNRKSTRTDRSVLTPSNPSNLSWILGQPSISFLNICKFLCFYLKYWCSQNFGTQ